MTTISALAVVGSPSHAVCTTCRSTDPYVDRGEEMALLPVPHADGCQVLAEERVLLRDDLIRADVDGVTRFHRWADPREGDLLAALGISMDAEALVLVEILDGRRQRTYAVADEDMAVTW